MWLALAPGRFVLCVCCALGCHDINMLRTGKFKKKSQSVVYYVQHAIFVHLHKNMNKLDDDDWKVPVGHRRLSLCLHIDDAELA